METIIYQGQSIEAARVNFMSGSLAIALYGDYYINHDGEEQLFRDPAGNYYLRRELDMLDVDGSRQTLASGRIHVHRLSLCAVLQWMAMRTNAQDRSVRQDISDLFTELADHRDEFDCDDPAFASYPESHDAGASGLPASMFAPPNLPPKSTLTLHLSGAQWGMLRQASRHDGKPMEKWALGILGSNVSVLLADEYGHDQERAEAGWNGDAEKPPRGCALHLFNADGTFDSTTQLSSAGRLKLEARARANGTDLATEYLAMLREGTESPKELGMTVGLDAEAAALVRQYHDASIYGYSSDDVASGCVISFLELALANRDEAEKLTGLHSADYHDGEWGIAEEMFDAAQERRLSQARPAGAGRRHTHDPADVALLAAAKPEALEDEEPLPEEEHVEDEDDDNAGEEWKEAK